MPWKVFAYLMGQLSPALALQRLSTSQAVVHAIAVSFAEDEAEGQAMIDELEDQAAGRTPEED